MENQGTQNPQNANPQNANPQFQQPFGQPFGQQQLPNATAVLVLGIISIVGCFCYGIIGLVLGIIAIVLSSKADKMYLANPAVYTEVSYKNMKAGRICAIVGTCLSALYFVIIIIYIAFIGTLLSGMPWEMFGRH